MASLGRIIAGAAKTIFYGGLLAAGVATCEQTVSPVQKKVGEMMIKRDARVLDGDARAPDVSLSFGEKMLDRGIDALVTTGVVDDKKLDERLSYYEPQLVDMKIYSRDGALVHEIHSYASAGLHWIDFKQLPLAWISPNIISAAVAAEDQRFAEHHGVDNLSLSKTIAKCLANLMIGRSCDKRGTSTIPLQLADRLINPSYKKTKDDVFPRAAAGIQDRVSYQDKIFRKGAEFLLAAQLLETYGSLGVLEMYLNIAYFSSDKFTRSTVVGMDAGAHHYFGKGAGAVTPLEAALLVATLNNPDYAMKARNDFLEGTTTLVDCYTRRDPAAFVTALDCLAGRTDYVLASWHAKSRAGGFQEEPYRRLSDEEYAGAMRNLRKRRLPFLRPEKPEQRSDVEEFVDALEDQLRALPFLFDQGVHDIEVYSTLDVELQQHARRVFREYLAKVREKTKANPDKMSGSIVVLDINTNDLLALIGNDGTVPGAINRATNEKGVNIGSVGKLFVYGLGVEHGFISLSDTYFDQQTIFSFPNADGNGRPVKWRPGNFPGRVRYTNRETTFFDALVDSRNVGVATVISKIINSTGGNSPGVGSRYVRDYLNQLGLGLSQYWPAASLGLEARPIDVAGALATFANGGFVHDYETGVGTNASLGKNMRLFTKLTYKNAQGETGVYVPAVRSTRFFSESTVSALDEALREVVSRGTGTQGKLEGYDLRGKTGTHDYGVASLLYSLEKDRLIFLEFGTTDQSLTGKLPGKYVNGGLVGMPAGKKVVAY